MNKLRIIPFAMLLVIVLACGGSHNDDPVLPEQPEQPEPTATDDPTGTTPEKKQRSAEAQRLYDYLVSINGRKMLSGAMANVNWNTNEAQWVYKHTNRWPAINCFDFIHHVYSTPGSWIDYSNTKVAEDWHRDGGIVAAMWHWNVPAKKSGEYAFYAEDTSFDVRKIFDQSSAEYKQMISDIDQIGRWLKVLRNKGIPVLWRPLHEAGGKWFWWGMDAEACKELWRVMYKRFADADIDNLIWVFTPAAAWQQPFSDGMRWYPGDEYVDIIGRDLYGYDAESQATEYSQLKALYPTKMITLSECGSNKKNSTVIPTADIAEAWNAGAKWLNFMPWYGENMPSNEWWNKVMDEEVVITRDEVNQNVTYIEETAQSAVNNFGLGWNLGNTLETNGAWIGNHQEYSKYETAWGQPLTTQAMFNLQKKNGFNAVRIPVTWVQHMDDEGNVDADWMARVKEVVDYAMNAGLYTIINVHHDTGAGELAWIKADIEVYNNTKDKFKKLWTQIANTFAEYDQHLIFEGYNEMLDNSNTWNAPLASYGYTALDNYAQDFVDAVRATGGNNTTRNLIVNTYAAANGSNVLNNFTIPTDKVANHLIAEVHSYDPWNFINTHTTWDDDCQNTLKGIFTDLNNKFTNIPYIIGEYGTSGDADESGKETVVNKESPAAKIQMAADQAANMVSLCKQNNSASFYWMSIFDGTDRSVPQWSLPTVVEAMQKANE